VIAKPKRNGFCTFHERAHENFQRSFAVWKKGLNIPWEDYLREIDGIAHQRLGKGSRRVRE
jgi:hypothetical protein